MNLEGKQCLASSCSRERGWWRQPHGEVDGWGGIRSSSATGLRGCCEERAAEAESAPGSRLNCVGGCVAPRRGRATGEHPRSVSVTRRLSPTTGLWKRTLLGSSLLTY